MAIDETGLHHVGRRPRLGPYVAELWRYRHFIVADARARAFSSGRGTVLGNAWLALQPMLNGLVYYLIFGLLLGTSRGIDNFVGYLLIGVFLFQYTSRTLSSGAGVIASGRNVIRGFSFPRATLPLATMLREALNMLPVLATMVLMILAIPPHAQLSWTWLLFPLVFLLHTAFNLGLILLTSRLGASFPDVKNVVGFVSRFWLYASGVMYSFDRFVEDPRLLGLLEANPLHQVLDMSRDVLLYGQAPAADSWLMLSAWAVGTCALGFLVFWQGEERYGRQ